jgi:hypothetical protein
VRLAPNDRVGPYEIVALVGAGGMGEVYRARDSRLGREVAIKVLPAAVAGAPDRLRRFELEARAAGSLSHPNVLTVFDVGSHEGAPFVVSELLEGETLRERVRGGGATIAKAVDVVVQITRGLAAAHDKGIVHRDLKPENLFITKDGRVKILDFGLAKLQTALTAEAGEAVEASIPTTSGPGAILGTVGYMAPEQIRGFPADHRADIFACGVIFYELLAGQRAFHGESTADIMTAILREDPVPLTEVNPNVPASLERIVARCLEKNPEDRFQSARDLGFALEALSTPSAAPIPGPPPQRPGRTGAPRLGVADNARRILPGWALALGVGAILFGIGVIIGRSANESLQPRFHQITYRPSAVDTARFARDGASVVYAAAWEGQPAQLFETRIGSPEARPLGLSGAEVLSISQTVELAVLLGPSLGLAGNPPHRESTARDPRLRFGTLARVPLGGGAPRELIGDVIDADWSPDGDGLAVVRFVSGKNKLEYPIGKTLYETTAWLYRPRISPDGTWVAFQEQRQILVSKAGGTPRLVHAENSASEIAWSADGKEIWFNQISEGATEIRAVTPTGRERLVATLPGEITLYDISRDGRILMGRVSESSEILGLFPGDTRLRNLSWFERSNVAALAADGGTVVFTEAGIRGSQQGPDIYVRRTDGSPAKLVGKGWVMDISRDGQVVLVRDGGGILLVPTGPGAPQRVPVRGVAMMARGGFLPDRRRIFAMGEEPGRGRRAYVVDLAGGKLRSISPEGTRRGIVSGDGRFVVACAADGNWYLYPTETGPEARVVGLQPGEEPTQWSDDSKALYVHGADLPGPGDSVFVTRIYALDPWSGTRTLVNEIPPISPTTGGGIGNILFAQGGKVCVFTHYRYSSELFLAEGL